jgi:predicted MPP superfamily phosphohydrolase
MRRRLVVTIFISVIVTVLIGGHLYIAQRLVLDPQLPSPWRSTLLAVLAALFATLLLQPIAERRWSRALSRLVAWPASLWMGLAFLLLTLVTFSDVTWLLLGAAAPLEASGFTGITAARARALSIAGIGVLVGLVAVRGALRPPVIRRIELLLPRWPHALDGFRIVQISDVHIGPILDRRFAAQVVARANALAPDLIAITGDLVDGSVRRVGDEVAPFADLRARHGVFFVTGNHDHYSGADAWAEHLRSLGMTVLRNQHVRIGDEGASFDLAGVEDHHAAMFGGSLREDLPGALAERDPQRAVVLLAHDPATFREAANLGVDLQLSGHTHGGQIWPFAYLVRLSTPYVAGLYREAGTQLYVSRGTGFWGPVMRLFAPAEITEIILRQQPEASRPADATPRSAPA